MILVWRFNAPDSTARSLRATSPPRASPACSLRRRSRRASRRRFRCGCFRVAVPTLLWAASELPLYLLARRAARRGAALREALPDALDLMRACLAAGLPLARSLSLVADHCAEPVAAEFACVAAETAFGIPQSTALDGLAARNPEPEVRALVSAIRQAERNGSPLAPVIAAQASDARLAHNRAIIERGARAGPKIQLVVSATIVPGALIGLAAIVIAAIARGELKLL